jgi:hypothetical protein
VVERRGVRVTRSGLGRQRSGFALEAALGLRDAGPPREVSEQRLPRPRVGLLRQVAGVELGGRARDRPGIRPLQAGEQPQQRGLPDAVRADEPEPAVVADRQRDVVEDGARAEVPGDARELNLHAWNPPDRIRGAQAMWLGARNVVSRSGPHRSAPRRRRRV